MNIKNQKLLLVGASIIVSLTVVSVVGLNIVVDKIAQKSLTRVASIPPQNEPKATDDIERKAPKKGGMPPFGAASDLTAPFNRNGGMMPPPGFPKNGPPDAFRRVKNGKDDMQRFRPPEGRNNGAPPPGPAPDQRNFQGPPPSDMRQPPDYYQQYGPPNGYYPPPPGYGPPDGYEPPEGYGYGEMPEDFYENDYYDYGYDPDDFHGKVDAKEETIKVAKASDNSFIDEVEEEEDYLFDTEEE